MFSTEENLKVHEETVHNKCESVEERESRLQRARWTELRPDQRIIQNSPTEKAEHLVLIHEDDIHYNLIVNKCHNIFKNTIKQSEHIPKNHNTDNVTIFGEVIQPKDLQTWAQKTGVFCPGSHSKITSKSDMKGDSEGNKKNTENIRANMEGWKTVAKAAEKEPDLFKVHTSNRFTDLF